MRRHQRGVTFVGWLFLILPLAIVAYAGIRLTPIYLNYMKVTHSLEQVSSEVQGDTATAESIRNTLSKHFQVDSLDYPDFHDIKITRLNGVWQMEANYDDQAPLFANMFILVTFDKTVKVKGGGGGG